jgi:tripartite-type tricarboxylate transporter receptor subunit TctC
VTNNPPRAFRRRALLGGLLALPAIRAARAGRPIDLIVGAAPGTSPDRGARAFAPFLERHLPGTRVRVVNLPGEAGVLAYRALAAADVAPGAGLTLGWVATPSLSARMVDRPDTAALMQAIRLVGAVQKESIAFVSAVQSALSSAQDLVARAAENAPIPLGTPPEGSPPHLAALRLQALVQRPLNIVAFPSAVAARQAALSQNVAAACLGLSDAIDGLRAGTLTGLGLAARTRSDALPDLPTLRASGLALTASILRGLAVPAAMDAGREAALQAALRAVVADPEFTDQATSSGVGGMLLDGTAWTAQAASERRDLAALWLHSPWTTSGVG